MQTGRFVITSGNTNLTAKEALVRAGIPENIYGVGSGAKWISDHRQKPDYKAQFDKANIQIAWVNLPSQGHVNDEPVPSHKTIPAVTIFPQKDWDNMPLKARAKLAKSVGLEGKIASKKYLDLSPEAILALSSPVEQPSAKPIPAPAEHPSKAAFINGYNQLAEYIDGLEARIAELEGQLAEALDNV